MSQCVFGEGERERERKGEREKGREGERGRGEREERPSERVTTSMAEGGYAVSKYMVLR